MSLRASAHTGVAIRFPKAFPWGGAPRSELKSNNCRWQLLHNVKVARASPTSARRMRAKSEEYCKSIDRTSRGAHWAPAFSGKLYIKGGRPMAAPTDSYLVLGHWFTMTAFHSGARKWGRITPYQPCPACFSSSGMKSRMISLSRVRS